MFSARFPFHQSIEGVVIMEIEVLLEIDGTSVALEAAAGHCVPPLRVEPKLVILGIAIVGRYTLQRRKAQLQNEYGHRYCSSRSGPDRLWHGSTFHIDIFMCGSM